MNYSSFDFKNYDNLCVSVKSNVFDEVMKCYESFGWQKAEAAENKRYGDLTTVNFIRPHKIRNKDQLQLLQVHMERSLNKLGELYKYKNVFSTVMGLIFGLVGCFSSACGLILAIVYTSVANIVVGTLIAAAGLAIIVVFLVFLPKLLKRENDRFLTRTDNLITILTAVCVEAGKLLEGNNEKQ